MAIDWSVLKRKSLWQSLGIMSVVWFAANMLFEPMPALAVYVAFIVIVNSSLTRWLVYWEWRGEYKKLLREYESLFSDFNTLTPHQKAQRVPHMAYIAAKLEELKRIVAAVHPDNLKKNKG